MKTTLKRICSIAVVFALILSLTGGYIDLFAQAAVYDNGDPFAAMYDSDALVKMELKTLNEHYAELEAQGAPKQNDTSAIFGISRVNAAVETNNSLHE